MLSNILWPCRHANIQGIPPKCSDNFMPNMVCAHSTQRSIYFFFSLLFAKIRELIPASRYMFCSSINPREALKWISWSVHMHAYMYSLGIITSRLTSSIKSTSGNGWERFTFQSQSVVFLRLYTYMLKKWFVSDWLLLSPILVMSYSLISVNPEPSRSEDWIFHQSMM